MFKLIAAIIAIGGPFARSGAQTCNATGATITESIQEVWNIKTNFNAVGNGIANDHQAFVNAAAAIQSAGGNVKLVIPAGTYIVGRQTPHLNNTATYFNNVYKGEIIMKLENISNVIIEGAYGAVIQYASGLRFGAFRLDNGAAPANLDRYNPSAPGSENPGADYKYAGTVGNFIDLYKCNNIEVKGLTIDGNNSNYVLGGNWGLGNRPIELANCYGINLADVTGITLKDVTIHHFGVDNLVLQSASVNNDSSRPISKNIVFNNVHASYAGRNNFSWLGGENICVKNSSFNYAATETINTKPGYGMDIEPEGIPGTVTCRNGYFENTQYVKNNSMGLTPGTSRDNAVPGVAGYGFSYNHYFRNCLLIASESGSAVHNYINRVTFDSCRFYGSFLNYGRSLNSITPPCIIKNCYFSDCLNGFTPSLGQTQLAMVQAYRMQLLNCRFDKYLPGYIYTNDGDLTTTCSDDSYKPLYEGNTFNYHLQPTGTLVYANLGRRTVFKNNHFYKANSDFIRWYNIENCIPGIGEGCANPNGDGLQYGFWPANYVYPGCMSTGPDDLRRGGNTVAPEVTTAGKLVIFPNPGHNDYTLQFPENTAKKIQEVVVQDLNGKTVWRSSLNSGSPAQLRIQLPAGASPGMYVCTARGKDFKMQCRFVKQ